MIIAAANNAYKLNITDRIDVNETNRNIFMIVIPHTAVE
jgi:hypothetical protein